MNTGVSLILSQFILPIDLRGQMNTLLQDLRYGLRMLAKNPGFTLVAVMTLALGIGANTTIFSVINATLLKPLPYPDPDRLVLVWKTFGKGPDNWSIVSGPNYWDWQRQNHVFENMAIFDASGRGYNLSPGGAGKEAEQVSGVRVSATFFSVLGVTPWLGRNFLVEEETLGKDHEVILSYELWKRRYEGNPALVGKAIKVDGADFTVVGVMPQGFQFQFWSGQRQLWVPAGYTAGDKERGPSSFVAVARLKRGVTVAQARTEMENIQNRLAQQYPDPVADGRSSATVMPMGDFGLEGLRRAMLALLAAAGFVLLIACVNVANLTLSRGAARQKEFAIRRALGAKGSRIARQLMTESVLLALLGGACGLLLETSSIGFLLRILPEDLTHLPFRQLNGIAVSGRVFGFALLVSGLTGVLFGLAPALGFLRAGVNEPLKEGGRGSTGGGRSRLRHALVACEVALALVVLSGAGLMVESMVRLLSVAPGFNPKNVLALGMSLPQSDLYWSPPVDGRFCQALDEHVSAVPGVVSVGAVSTLPFQGHASRSFLIEGRPPDPEHEIGAAYGVACPGFFRTMGVPLLAGREFTHQDTVDSPGVIVINQAMARYYWPKEDPIGRRIVQRSKPLVVVGVVGDMRIWGLDEQTHPQFFRPYTQAAWPFMNMVVRTTAAPAAFLGQVKKVLTDIEPDRPVSNVQTMEDLVHDSVGSRRFPMLLLVAFALLGLVLAAVGILGVVSYSVAQRTHEIGIRMALGARTGDVLALMVAGNMKWVLAGTGLGILGSLGLTRLLGKLLYEVRPADPMVLGAVSLALVLVALLASYLPARRAARVDPMVALRCE